MKPWYKIGIVSLMVYCFSLLGVKAVAGSAVEFRATDHPIDTNIVYHQVSPVGDKGKYIKQFSAYGPEYGANREMLSSEETFEAQLTEINQRTGKDGVKVYVVLINGLSTTHYNEVPENANDVSKVLEWSKNKKKIESDFSASLKAEAKQIIEKIAAQQASVIGGPSVFCSLIEYEVKYSESTLEKDRGKKVILYHSTAYNFSEKETYLQALDEIVKANATTIGSLEAARNMEMLVKSIRQQVQAYQAGKLDLTASAALQEKLLTNFSKQDISRCIDTLSKDMLNRFSDKVRAHVIRVLIGSDESSGIATGNIPVYSKVLNAEKNALAVLENIDDVNLNRWYTYINTPVGTGKTTLHYISDAVSRSFFGTDGYTKFTQLINKQIGFYQDFTTKREELSTQKDKEDHLIVWDKSYALNFFDTAPLLTNKYEVEFLSTGKLKLTKSTVRKWNCISTVATNDLVGGHTPATKTCVADWKKEAPILLDPFELVGFVNRSDLSLLTPKETNTDNFVVVPALHLLYAQEQQWNKSVKDGFSIAIDVATLVVPISKLAYGPALARKLIYGIELSDKVASVATLSSTFGFGGEKYAKVVELYGRIHFFLSFGTKGYEIKLSRDQLRDMAEFVAAVRELETATAALAAKSEELRYVIALKNNIDEEASAFKGADWVEKTLGTVKLPSTSLSGLPNYPKIKEAYGKLAGDLRNKGIDEAQFESVLKKSDDLDYLEENPDVLAEMTQQLAVKKLSDAELLNILNHSVNVDFVKTTLPKDFVSSLKDFGKTEGEIFDYFVGYHQVHTRSDFYNKIGKVIESPSSTLTRDESYAVWAYTTNLFYRDLNKWLREGSNVQKTDAIAKLLKDAIRKVPNYEGEAYREFELSGASLKKFMTDHKPGAKVTYAEFLSCKTDELTAFTDSPYNIRIYMNLHRAPDISDYSHGIHFGGNKPKELLLRRGSYFEVIDSYEADGFFHVYLKQLN